MLRDIAFSVTGGLVVGPRQLDPPGNTRRGISVRPASSGDVTATEECDARGAHLHRGRQDAVQPAGAHRQRA